MPNNMKISEAGIRLIVSFENEILKGYICPAGVLTVGIGHAVLPGEPYRVGAPITLEESRRLFAKDVADFERAVNASVTRDLTQTQFDACVCLAFNIGAGAFQKSSVARFINAGNFASAAQSFLLWNKGTVKGKRIVIKGLVRRRSMEKALFETV
jgi:lysozyme